MFFFLIFSEYFMRVFVSDHPVFRKLFWSKISGPNQSIVNRCRFTNRTFPVHTYHSPGARVWATRSTARTGRDLQATPAGRNQSPRPCRPARPACEKYVDRVARRTRVYRRYCPPWTAANSFCRWSTPLDGCLQGCPDTTGPVWRRSDVLIWRTCLAKATCCKKKKTNNKLIRKTSGESYEDFVLLCAL